jgi:hypothetical protein
MIRPAPRKIAMYEARASPSAFGQDAGRRIALREAASVPEEDQNEDE